MDLKIPFGTGIHHSRTKLGSVNGTHRVALCSGVFADACGQHEGRADRSRLTPSHLANRMKSQNPTVLVQ